MEVNIAPRDLDGIGKERHIVRQLLPPSEVVLGHIKGLSSVLDCLVKLLRRRNGGEPLPIKLDESIFKLYPIQPSHRGEQGRHLIGGLTIVTDKGILKRRRFIYQSAPNKEFARGDRIVATVVNLSIGEHQTVQCYPFSRDDLSTPRVPSRLLTRSLAEMSPQLLYPRDLNFRGEPREDAGCLNDLRRHNPFLRVPTPIPFVLSPLRRATLCALFSQRGPGKDGDLPSAAGAIGVGREAIRHLPKKAAQDRAMNRPIPPIDLFDVVDRSEITDSHPHRLLELLDEIPPLSHPHVREKVRFTEFSNLRLALR